MDFPFRARMGLRGAGRGKWIMALAQGAGLALDSGGHMASSLEKRNV